MLFSRVGVNGPVLAKEAEELNNFNFNEYKKFMKHIKNEYPHLSISAQQQMAIERCAKLNEGHQSLSPASSHKPPKFSMPNVLGEVMAKLHFNLASEENGIAGDRRPSTDESCSTNEDVKRTGLARPRRVTITDQKMPHLHEFDCSDSDNDDVDDSSLAADSLTDSLKNIETTSFTFGKQPQPSSHGQDVTNMNLSYSCRRLSLMSVLSDSDIDEDEIEESANNN